MDPVVHFELPAVDRERMAAFYSAAFGWEARYLGPEMGDYTVVTTTPTENGRPTVPGTINGGLFVRSEEQASWSPSIVIGVDDVMASLDAVVRSGGTVTAPPVEIPGIGWYANFEDTEGNRVSVLQPVPLAGATPA
jgi:predicted enzyme related to lactoylglutathione lyase